MIRDGYTRHITIPTKGTDTNFWYRPATKSERAYLRHAGLKLSEAAANAQIREFVTSHIVHSDVANNAVDLRNRMGMWSRDEDAFERLFLAVQGLTEDSSGRRWAEDEDIFRANLEEGVQLLRLNPKLAKRSCDDCRVHWYSEKTGEVNIVNSTGLPMLRDGPPPCELTSCLKGHWKAQKTLNRQNRWALEHYKECVAVGSFPDDAIVRQNAVIIRRVMEAKLKTA